VTHDDVALKRALDGLPRSIEPPDDLWPAVQARLRPRRSAWWTRRGALRIAAGLAVLVACASWLVLERHGSTTWRLAGNTFAPGDSLMTGASDRVRLAVGRIGEVRVEPDTRVRLLEARATRHRLQLAVGTIEAHINAPPRLFIVETPAGTVVDLGCAYTLEADSTGATRLEVSLGWVAFEVAGHEALVPAGFRSRTPRGGRPGLPIAADAAAGFANAASAFEAGAPAALDTLLATARPVDAVTLWHLLARTDGTARQRVFTRLSALAPPPSSVRRADVLALDRLALRLWWVELPRTIPVYPTWALRIWQWWLWITD
jgi:hypothetical protein